MILSRRLTHSHKAATCSSLSRTQANEEEVVFVLGRNEVLVGHRHVLLQQVHRRERRPRVAQNGVLERLEVRGVGEVLALRREALDNAEAPIAPTRVVRDVDPGGLHTPDARW